MKIEAPPYMAFEYDSNTPASDIPEPFEGEVQQLKAVLGAEFSFKMKPSGEIESVKFPDATLKKLREGLPQREVSRKVFGADAQGLRDPAEPASVSRGPARARQELGQQAQSDRSAAGNARPGTIVHIPGP